MSGHVLHNDLLLSPYSSTGQRHSSYFSTTAPACHSSCFVSDYHFKAAVI